MSLYEHKLISKILDEENFFVLAKYNITEEDFTVAKEPYNFIKQYVAKNGGKIPDYRTVIDKFESFEYYADNTDTFKFLCSELKNNTAKRHTYQLLQNEAGKKFSSLSGTDFVKWVKEEVNRIDSDTSINNTDGSNYAINGLERKQRYEYKKEHGTNEFVPMPFESVTNGLGGGAELGDYILLTAFTNRGKSWIATLMGVNAYKNGFSVLHYAPELTKTQQEERLDTIWGHFDNMKLRSADIRNEKEYLSFLESFNSDVNKKPYIVKTMEDMKDGLTLELIEADIVTHEAQVVIIDGFMLMKHPKATSERNAYSMTSRQLRQMFSRNNVLGLVIHQVGGKDERDNNNTDEFGERVLKCPELHQYSETVSVIQDASIVMTYDYANGRGKLKVVKARTDCVGLEIDLLVNYNEGYITEHNDDVVPDFEP